MNKKRRIIEQVDCINSVRSGPPRIFLRTATRTESAAHGERNLCGPKMEHESTQFNPACPKIFSHFKTQHTHSTLIFRTVFQVPAFSKLLAEVNQ